MFSYRECKKAIRSIRTGELRWLLDFGSKSYVGSDNVGRDCTKVSPSGSVLISSSPILENNVCIKEWGSRSFLTLEDWEEYPNWATPIFIDYRHSPVAKLQKSIRDSFAEEFLTLKTGEYHEQFVVYSESNIASVQVREWNNPRFEDQVEQGGEILAHGEWRRAIPEGWSVQTDSEIYKDGEMFCKWRLEIKPRSYVLTA